MRQVNNHHLRPAARWLAMLLAALAAACDASTSPAPILGTPMPSPTPRVGATRLLAELIGQLRLVDGCLRVESNFAPESLLLVWPVDITATVYLQTVVVTDETSRQQATWQAGEIVTVGGGNIPSVGEGLRRVGPASCPGPYWLVGSVEPSATATPGTAAPTATPTTPVTRERAIDLATHGCWDFHLALVGAPRNIRAQLVTLAEANQLTSSGGALTDPGLSPGSLVWLVQMDGHAQIVGGVNPTPGGLDLPATPRSIEATCAISIDAQTGNVVGLSEHSL